MTDIAQLGYAVDSSQLTKGTVALDKHTAAAQRTDTATAKLDKQFKQLKRTEWEMSMLNRQLPMQFTDIATSLATGQRPMMVFLQQGGQIKDMAGGIVPALRAMGGYVMSLINPLTLAAGAVGVFVLAWSQFEERQNSIDRALIRTGRFTEEYAARLRDLSTEMDDIVGVTAGSASKAIAQVASTGRFSGEQLETVARAAETWRAATGDAIEDVVKDFAKLRGDPIKAALELNRTYGFLTQSVLDQAEALVEQGRETDATNLLVNSLADTLERRAPQMSERVGSIAAAFRGMGRAASETWDSVVEGMDQAFDQGVRLLAGLPGLAQGYGAFLRMMQEEGRKTGGAAGVGGAGGPTEPIVDSDEIEAARKATEKWQRLTLSNLSKQERLEAEIRDIRETGKAANKSEAEIEKAIADARARYTQSLRKGRAIKADPTAGIIERLQKQIALNQSQAQSTDALTATERQLLAIEVELANLGAKVGPKRRAEIDALMEKARATDAAAQAAERANKAEEALSRLRQQTALAEANQRRANEIDLIGMGRGAEATQMLRRQLELHRWYEDQVTQLRRQAALEKREITAEEEQELKDSLQRQLDEERRYQEERQRLMGDWKIGASAALENYIERSRDVAGQWQDIWGEALNTFEEMGVDSLHGSLGDWEDYFDNIERMILRFIVNQQLTRWLESLKGWGSENSGSGGFAGFAASFIGDLLGGGRARGGSVIQSKIYPVAETGDPELLKQGGKTWLIPGSRGTVIPARNEIHGHTSQSSPAGVFRVEIVNKGAPMQVESAKIEQQPDGTMLARIVTNTWRERFARGEFDRDFNRQYGLQRQGVLSG